MTMTGKSPTSKEPIIRIRETANAWPIPAGADEPAVSVEYVHRAGPQRYNSDIASGANTASQKRRAVAE